jgi:hypothetical protein
LYELHEPRAFAAWRDELEASSAEVVYAGDIPIKEWNRAYGNLKNTLAIMLAHALHEGAEMVAMFNAPHIGEPTNEQRESVAYWFGVLMGAGIPVIDRSRFIDWNGVYEGVA